MSGKGKTIAGVVVLVVAALLVWQVKKRSGKDSSETTAGKVTAGGKTSGTKAASLAKAQEPAELVGTVTADGKGVTAIVTLSPVGHRGERVIKPQVAAASDDGNYKFSSIEPGAYRVSAAHSGFLPTVSKVVELDSGGKETVDLTLKSGGHPVEGQITDITGGPVGGAFVRLTPVAGILDPRADRAFSTIADAEGKFSTHAADGIYVLSAHHPDYVSARRRVELAGGNKELTLSLVPGGVIEGRVVLEGSNAPLGGAIVNYRRETVGSGFVGMTRQSRESGQVTAGPDGKFRITGAGAGLIRISAETASATSRDSVEVPLGIAETVTGVDVIIASAFQVSGTVVDDKGKPVSGASVVAAGDGIFKTTESSADGSFAVGPLPSGKYSLSASQAERMMMGGGGTKVAVEAKNVDGVELVAKGSKLTIRGRVEPASDAEVGVAWDKPGHAPMMLSTVRTDDDGNFELGPVSPGDTVPLRATSADGRLGEVEVKVGDDGAEGVVISLKEAASISGRVVDEKNKPVAGATVALRLEQQTNRMVMINGAEVSARRSVSAPDGTFKVAALEAGDYKLSVKNERGQTLFWAKKPNNTEPMELSLAEAEQKTGLTLAVGAQNHEIRGQVFGPDGKPAADVFVSASPTSEFSFAGRRPPRARERQEPPEGGGEGEERETRSETMMVVATGDGDGGSGFGAGGFMLSGTPVVTDDEGRFVIGDLREGNYDLTAEGLRGTARAFANKVATDSDITIKLQPLTVLEGVVTRGGEAVREFRIGLTGPTRFSRSYNSEDGSFKIRRLDPGTYKLTASGDGGETEMKVDVVLGQPTKIEVVLQKQSMVSGRLVDDKGEAVSGAMIVMSPRRDDGEMEIRIGEGGPPAQSDKTGKFSVAALPGSYTLIAIKPSQGPLAMKPVDVTGDDVDLGDIVTGGQMEPPE